MLKLVRKPVVSLRALVWRAPAYQATTDQEDELQKVRRIDEARRRLENMSGIPVSMVNDWLLFYRQLVALLRDKCRAMRLQCFKADL